MYTTIHKIDNQQGLLYTTGNSTQYSVITYYVVVVSGVQESDLIIHIYTSVLF